MEYSKKPRKTKTSTAVKRRYNNANYKALYFQLPIVMIEAFREKTQKNGVSMASIIKTAIENYLDLDSSKVID